MREASNMPPAGDYPVGYKKPPRQHQFKRGQSGNPRGRKRKERPDSIGEVFATLLTTKRTVTEGGRKTKMTFLNQLARRLVANAAQGDIKSLNAIVKLSEGGADGLAASWRPMGVTYEEGMSFASKYEMTEAFFKEEERRAKGLDLPESMPTLIDRELRRRVQALRDGNPVRVTMLDVITNRFMKIALEGDIAVLALIMKIAPKVKLGKPSSLVYVIRPTLEELEKCGPEDRSLWPTPRPSKRSGSASRTATDGSVH